ncbi:MAG TPA: 50S ribosomal protein L6 [Microbacteriaceae bacterium]|nr:50S ribosomal protein L6 [Microbacteriaceae bacterium]
MSRIGKLPIGVPGSVNVEINGQVVTVKGPKGELTHKIKEPIGVTFEDGQISVSRPNEERESRALHGLTRTLIANNVVGVTEGFAKELEVVGTGYRVQQKGGGIELTLGFSHPVQFEAPQGVTLEVEGNNKITVRGVDKQVVGETAANIRKLRRPEPYKGKGVRYAGEVVRRKAGKAGK